MTVWSQNLDLMPKDTFNNLDSSKKAMIVKAFITEFTLNPYDEASISKVVKQIGIAKGCVYQYFDNKLDLYIFLMNECVTEKARYVNIDRKDFMDFWAYFRKLYEAGYQFDAEHPLKSHFLHRLMQNTNSPSIMSLYKDLMDKSIAAFNEMIQYEINAGLFRSDIPVEIMGHMLYKTGVAIMEYMEHECIITPNENIKHELPVFHGKKELLIDTVENHIQLIRPAFDKE